MTRCDRAQCLRPVVGTLHTCRDGIRRAMCAIHTIAELRHTRSLTAIHDGRRDLRQAIPAFRELVHARSKANTAHHDRVAKRVLREHVVCNCTYYGGRLMRACSVHAKGER